MAVEEEEEEDGAPSFPSILGSESRRVVMHIVLLSTASLSKESCPEIVLLGGINEICSKKSWEKKKKYGCGGWGCSGGGGTIAGVRTGEISEMDGGGREDVCLVKMQT